MSRPPCAGAGRDALPLVVARPLLSLLSWRSGLALFSVESVGAFVGPFGLLPAQALGRGAQPAADALRLRLLGGFRLLGLGVRVVLAADELDLRDFGAVAAAVADAQDPRIAARTRFEPRRDRVEQLADDVAVLDVAQHQAPRVQRLAVRLAAGEAALGDA